MKRSLWLVAIAAMMLLAFATPVAAAKPAGNPNTLCAENIFLEDTPFGVFPLEIPSHGGCASSWATGEVSTAAYVAQCKWLEENFGVDYPYAFYGRYPAENRADCVYFLRGFHTGTIEPGPGT